MDFTEYFVARGERFALPALGRAAGRRPTGKMLRRRKRLGIAPESPASGARFVRRRLCQIRFQELLASNALKMMSCSIAFLQNPFIIK